MSRKFLIWCAHPCHEEILSNGKRRCLKTGPKPTHPLGQRSINKELADFINNHYEGILNGTSKLLSTSDYLCTTCFTKEKNNLVYDKMVDMDIHDTQESVNFNLSENESDDLEHSPMDIDYILSEQDDIKRKLNHVLEFLNVKKIHDM